MWCVETRPGEVDHFAHQRIAVGVDPGRSEPEDNVTRCDIFARQQAITFRRSDRKPREVIIALLVDPGHLGGLAADQGASSLPAALGDTGYDRCPDLGIELAAGEIVEKEQRLGALHHEIVHRHGHEVDADRVVPARRARDLHLGPHSVSGCHQDRVAKARSLEVEQAAEAADICVGTGPRGTLDQRLDELNHPVAGVDIHTGLGVGQPVIRHDSSAFWGARMR